MKNKRIITTWLVFVLCTYIVSAAAGTVIIHPGYIAGTISVTDEDVKNGRADAYSDPAGYEGHDYSALGGEYSVTVEGDHTYMVTAEAQMYDITQSDHDYYSYLFMGRQEVYVPIYADPTDKVILDFSMVPGYIAPVVTVPIGFDIEQMRFYASTNIDPSEGTYYYARHFKYAKGGYYLDGETSFPMKPWASYDANGNGNYNDPGDTYLLIYGYVNIRGVEYFLQYQYIDVIEKQKTEVSWNLDMSSSIKGSVDVYQEEIYQYQVRGQTKIEGNDIYFTKIVYPGSEDYQVYVQPATWDIYPQILFIDPSPPYKSNYLRLPTEQITVNPGEVVEKVWSVDDPSYITGSIDLYGAYGNLDSAFVYASSQSTYASAYAYTRTSDLWGYDYKLILYAGEWDVGYPYTRLTFDYEDGVTPQWNFLEVFDYRIPYNPPTIVSPGETIEDVDFSYGTATITINYKVAGGGWLQSPELIAKYSEGTWPYQIISNARGRGIDDSVQFGEATVTVLAGSHTISAFATVEGSYTKFGEFTITVEPGDVIVGDIDAPTVVVTHPAAGQHICGSSVLVEGMATDDIGVETITVNGDPVMFTPTPTPEDPNLVSFSTTVDGLVVGENTITIVATDAAENSFMFYRTIYRDPCNLPPEIISITGPLDPVAIGNSIEMTGTFKDLDEGDTHTAIWDWGDGTSSPGVVDQIYDTVTGEHVYETPGVYTVTFTVIDSFDESDSATWSQFSVIYDPSAGFVTGGGWIDSPAGAYPADPDLSGKANFGFVSKYKKGTTEPTGNTEFLFHTGDLNFHSGTYEWLVIAGAQAKFKGTGTINGEGSYKFMVTAVDSELCGGGALDTFRIKIWIEDEVTGEEIIIYDNGLEGTEIDGGSIKIHQA